MKDVWHNVDFEKQKLRSEGLPEATILDEAKQYVYADRNEDYGHPKIDFARIATMWRAYFVARGDGVVNISATDVAKMMVLLKLSRMMHSYHRDSVVDLAGYAATIERIEEEK